MAKSSDAHVRAVMKYNKEKTKKLVIDFTPATMDIYDYICAQGNKAGYIKELVRRDMEKGE